MKTTAILQTIQGTKIFTDAVFKKGYVSAKSGVRPSSGIVSQGTVIISNDETNPSWLSTFERYDDVNVQAVQMALHPINADGTEQAWRTLNLTYENATGNCYGICPTPPASYVGDMIATTAWVNNAISNSIKTTRSAITFKEVPGVTIYPRDNVIEAHSFIISGNLLIINLDLILNGTYTGPSGWVDIYDLPGIDGKSHAVPWFVDLKSVASLQGHYIYINNGQVFNSTEVRGQIIVAYI